MQSVIGRVFKQEQSPSSRGETEITIGTFKTSKVWFALSHHEIMN